MVSEPTLPDRTVEEQNEIAAAQRLARARDLSRAFREVFEQSPRGRLVLQALKSKFAADGTIPQNILGADEHTDLWQTSRRLGHWDVIEYIKLQLEWKEVDHGNTGSTGT